MSSHDGRIRTTQTGSLPRPDHLIELNRARRSPGAIDEQIYQVELQRAVAGVVLRQQEIGLDVPGDGEYGKAMGQRVDYGAWWSYSFQRLGGLELGSFDLYRDSASAPRSAARIRLASFGERRDWQRFADAYADPEAGAAPGRAVRPDGPRPMFPTCTGH